MIESSNFSHHWHDDELATEADDERHRVFHLSLDVLGLCDRPDAEADDDGDDGGGDVEDQVGRPLATYGRHRVLSGRHRLNFARLVQIQKLRKKK